MDFVNNWSQLDQVVKKRLWKYMPSKSFIQYVDLRKRDGKPPQGFGTLEFAIGIRNFMRKINPKEPDVDPKDFYTLTNETERHVKRFNTTGRQFTLKFTNLDAAKDLGGTVREVLRDMIATVLKDVKENDLIGFSLNHPGLNKGQIWLPFLPLEQLTADRIMEKIVTVLNANQDFSMDHEVQMKFVVVRNMLGGMKIRYVGNIDERLEEMYAQGGGNKTLLKIGNDDHMCLARAIAVGISRHQYLHKEIPTWKYKDICENGVRKGKLRQKKFAQALCQASGVAETQLCGVEEVALFQGFVTTQGYQLKVISLEAANSLVLEGPPAARPVYLYYHHEHFEPIVSMASCVNKGYYCDACNVGYDNKLKHMCEKVCPDCHKPGGQCEWLDLEFPYTRCPDCNRGFQSQKCFDNHKGVIVEGAKRRKVTSVCDQIKICGECGQLVNKARDGNRQHICEETYCRQCKARVPKGHQCYIQPIREKDQDEDLEEVEGVEDLLLGDEAEEARQLGAELGITSGKNPSFLVYDFETTQNTVAGRNKYGVVYSHEVNCVCSVKICAKCWNNGLKECDHTDTPAQRVFTGKESLKEFCEYVFSRENMGVYAIAHNSKGFDSQFILDYCHKQGVLPKVIMRGLEILSFEALGVKFRDSLNYLQMPLSAMPKAFGFTELKKRVTEYFPYLFNTEEHESYVGPLPKLKYYAPQSLKVEAREKLEAWHMEEKVRVGNTFDMMAEMISYCQSDVTILANCVMRYRGIMEKRASVDVFVESTTIASACNRSFRKLCLQPENIAIIPPGGYRQKERFSVIALKWLKWVMITQNVELRHAAHLGEISVKHGDKWYKIDGQDLNNYNSLYEFHGCYFHGCPKCIRNRSSKVAFGRLNAKEAYDATVKKTEDLRGLGFTVTEMWECELNQQLKANPEMKRWFAQSEIREPLNPRDALAGGCTETVAMHYKCKPGEKIHYVDVVSLYPWVNKYGAYPIGHPKIQTERLDGFTYMNPHLLKEYHGLFYCKVLPNRALRLPILPYRLDGKLFFVSCRTCLEDKAVDLKCEHTDEERAITGVWVSDELYFALDRGYKILENYEVWKYDRVAQYDNREESTGLFTKYINTFLKPKQEADGWPAWATTDELKKQYIEDYYVQEGIHLENVEANPALRASSKIALNSFWGKFCQNEDLSKVEYFMDPLAYTRLVFDPTVEVQSVRDLNGQMMMVNYKSRNEYLEALPFSNVVIGAYTTAQARLKLYSYIEMLDPEQVLYMDTDSLFYVQRTPDDKTIRTGQFLGDMSDELEKDFGAGSYITEFVSAGAKNYGYKVQSAKSGQEITKVKVKGFCLNSHVAETINFDTMKRFVDQFLIEEVSPEAVVEEKRIQRRPVDVPITAPQQKTYRVVFDKRIPLRRRRMANPNQDPALKNIDFISYPHGFKRQSAL